MSEAENILEGQPSADAADFASSDAGGTEETSVAAVGNETQAPQEGEEREGTQEGEPAPVLSRADRKKSAYKYILFAVIALACVYAAQLFRLLAPVFDPIYYGNLTDLFVSVCQAIFWVPCIVVLHREIKRFTGFNVFRRPHKELSLKRSLIIYACAVVPIFIVSAALGWELKLVYELGKRVTMMQLSTNAVQYANGAVKLLLTIVMIELVQEAGDLLYTGKYREQIPWGGIAVAVVFGFLEVWVASSMGSHTAFLFSWLYIAFDLLYGVIYLLSKKRFSITYCVSLIIYIL